jgi:hypothetical protein
MNEVERRLFNFTWMSAAYIHCQFSRVVPGIATLQRGFWYYGSARLGLFTSGCACLDPVRHFASYEDTLSALIAYQWFLLPEAERHASVETKLEAHTAWCLCRL